MSVLDSMQGFLEKHVGPIAHKVSSFKVVKGLMSGMMATMPVTLGVALLSIINGLPIPPLQAFLATMDPKTIVLYFVLLAVDVVVCLPFIKAYDKTLVEAEAAQEKLAA